MRKAYKPAAAVTVVAIFIIIIAVTGISTLAAKSRVTDKKEVSGTLEISGLETASVFSAAQDGSSAQEYSAPSSISYSSVESSASEQPKISVGLEEFISRVIEIAQNEPQYPVEDGATKYGELFGTPKYQWCTVFLMYCIKQAENELETSFIGDAYPWRDSAWDTGLWYKKKNRYFNAREGYIPGRGDLVIFDSVFSGYPNHIAMVVGIEREDGRYYISTIEGNIPEDEVKQIRSRRLWVDEDIIMSYCSMTGYQEYSGSLIDYSS